MTEIGKSYISDSIQDLELLFFNNEQHRLKKIKFPFYDGGLTPIVIYYTRKYKLPIKFPIFIENIKGNTLFEITSNFYPYNMNSMNRMNLETPEFDLFATQYIKNYYFSNTFYDIKVVYNKFKGLYEAKQLNQYGQFHWMDEITNVLLSFIAVKEKKSIGINDNDIKSFDEYIEFVKEITEEYMINYPNKSDDEYITNFWIYQLLNPTSKAIKSEGIVLINSLIKKRIQRKLWDVDYILNWIFYGLIKDYLSSPSNLDNFLKTYSLKEITKGLVYEAFSNPDSELKSKTKSKSKLKMKKTSKNKSKSKSKSKNKIINKSKKTKEISGWKTIMIWILLPLVVFLGIRLMMFFWSTIFTFIAK
jgi:hypothetical protein